ncbi:MAG: acetate uptake transporter [Candidatus Cloacimonetes bacterium]|nr:acetate uptake transporter [Candidatus Cloacimonadota bacterium]
MTERKYANPAVVGLAGFSLTTLVLQFHNVGWCGLGPVVALGFIFGGLAQMIAGFQEQKMGNNFGYSAFVSYGSFWIGLGMIFLMKHFNIYVASTTDVGWYLVAWMIYTFLMWTASWRIHTAMSLTFFTLFLGFLLLVLGHFGDPIWNKVAGFELMVCAGLAMYMMLSIITNDLAGKIVLPLGKPWIKAKTK